MQTLKCKYCGEDFVADGLFDLEQELWGHIQLEHKEIFNNVVDLETPYMIEECFDI